MNKIAVVIPCYNEALTIEKVVKGILINSFCQFRIFFRYVASECLQEEVLDIVSLYWDEDIAIKK